MMQTDVKAGTAGAAASTTVTKPRVARSRVEFSTTSPLTVRTPPKGA